MLNQLENHEDIYFPTSPNNHLITTLEKQHYYRTWKESIHLNKCEILTLDSTIIIIRIPITKETAMTTLLRRLINIPQRQANESGPLRAEQRSASASESINTRRSALPPPIIYGPTAPPAHTLASVYYGLWKSSVPRGDLLVVTWGPS